jgi:hypothetical protein
MHHIGNKLNQPLPVTLEQPQGSNHESRLKPTDMDGIDTLPATKSCQLRLVNATDEQFLTKTQGMTRTQQSPEKVAKLQTALRDGYPPTHTLLLLTD